MMWGWPNMMGGIFGGFGFIWMIFIFLFVIAIIAGVIILIVWAIRRSSGIQQSQQKPVSTAMETLKVRYAKGEIKKEEFENIKKDLMS